MVSISINEIFQVILYILGSILLITLIVFTIKLMKTLKKVDKIVDDVDNKMQSLNGAFDIIDTTTNALSSISDKVVDFIVNGLLGIFNRKNKKEEIEDE